MPSPDVHLCANAEPDKNSHEDRDLIVMNKPALSSSALNLTHPRNEVT